ncbi:hypothetical protein KLP40_05595 [Hymenobacter sp. NST-14]|nr:hypothetical protein [Hymenobacter piscis]MBT9392631.1 hypothetical protein [Hymenobacter piscis]
MLFAEASFRTFSTAALPAGYRLPGFLRPVYEEVSYGGMSMRSFVVG